MLHEGVLDRWADSFPALVGIRKNGIRVGTIQRKYWRGSKKVSLCFSRFLSVSSSSIDTLVEIYSTPFTGWTSLVTLSRFSSSLFSLLSSRFDLTAHSPVRSRSHGRAVCLDRKVDHYVEYWRHPCRRRRENWNRYKCSNDVVATRDLPCERSIAVWRPLSRVQRMI